METAEPRRVTPSARYDRASKCHVVRVYGHWQAAPLVEVTGGARREAMEAARAWCAINGYRLEEG